MGTGTTMELADRYALSSLIARGGTASVYLAHDDRLERVVAVKLLTARATLEAAASGNAELAIASVLHHPGFMPVLDAGTVDGPDGAQAFIVMEYSGGRSLRELSDRQALESCVIAEIGAQVADALHYLHQRGWVHLDVKPGNVMVEPAPAYGYSRRARLIDLGIARPMAGSARVEATTVTASAAYMSPEHVLGNELTGASDVYSLGLVLLRCLTGREEFTGSRLDVATERLRRDPAIPTGLPAAWATLVAAMTARTPSERPAACEVAVELGELARRPQGGHEDAAVRHPRWHWRRRSAAIPTAELVGA